ncbi:QRFP-like peptide receptor [Daphnia carinata]|uniref:QRFP-like peptide receptor n=1 Tax=Daphnia carinata TaxID=120202 RepID=UPI00257CF9D6|nr:QRFP-like peptide receptor [Daphnia carinata]
MSVSIFGTMTSEVDAEHLSSDALFYPSCENATTVTDISQFNFSEFDYPGGGGPWPPPLDFISAMKITFCVINMIVSILGNCAVIIAVYHNPALRSTINFYLVNLAVADVLIALCCMWPHLVNDLTKPAFILGAFMCKFNAFAQMTCLTSSVLTLTAISCDRFMAVMYPLRVRITQCRARAVIISIWIISITVALPFAVYRKLFEIQWRNALEVTCQETWPSVLLYDPKSSSCISRVWPKTVYYSLVSAVLFFLPIVVMSIAYTLIIGRLWGSKPPGEKMDAALSNQARAKRKKFLLYQVVKMVCVIMLVFIICWAPLQVLILFAQFSHNSQEFGELPEWYDQVMFLVYSIAYTNSTLNPLLYGGLNQTYRKTLIRVLFRKCCKWRTNRSSAISMQGSIQMAEFRTFPRAGVCNNHLSNTTHSTRFAVRRGANNLNQQTDAISVQQHNRLSVRISTTVATSSLRCHLPATSAVAIHPPPATSATVQMEYQTAHPADSTIACETPDREMRFSVSRANRSRTASHRRRQELLG